MLTRNPEIQAEVERIQRDTDPEAYEILTTAMLTARRDDKIDWQARIAAAKARIQLSVSDDGDPGQSVRIIDLRTVDGPGQVVYGDDELVYANCVQPENDEGPVSEAPDDELQPASAVILPEG